jgi:hypothetical protein
MNVVIAKILHYPRSLHDHQGPRNMYSDSLKPLNGLGPFSRFPTENSCGTQILGLAKYGAKNIQVIMQWLSYIIKIEI